MPYVGKKPADIIATSVDTDTGAFSGNVTAGGTLGVTGETTLATHLNLGDNDKIKLGASADLEIFHDGSNSKIVDGGTGNLNIQADDFNILNAAGDESKITASSNGAVQLLNDNSVKLATSGSGITVTGNIANASGDFTLDVASDINLDADSGNIYFKDGDTGFGAISNVGGDTAIYSTTSGHEGLRLGNGAIVPVNNAGASTDNACNLGGATGRFSDFYLAGNIYIGGTGSANAFSDYEEGTWTPATNSSSYNTGSSTGRYTKIGRIVIVHFAINFSGVNSSSNSIVNVTNLPFTSTSDIAFSGSVREQSNTGAIYTTRLGPGATIITMNSMDNITNGSQRTIRTSENYSGTMTYMV